MIGLALTDGDTTYLASSSYEYTLQSCLAKDINMPHWAVKSSPNTIVSYLGEQRPGEAIRFGKSLLISNEEPLTSNMVIRQVLRNSIGNLRSAKLILEDDLVEKIWAPMYIAKNNLAYKLDPFGNVTPVREFDCAGCAYERAYGVLHMTRNCKDVKYRILKAMSFAMDCAGVGNYPIVIRNTKDVDKPEVYSMMDTMLYIHDYEVKHK